MDVVVTYTWSVVVSASAFATTMVQVAAALPVTVNWVPFVEVTETSGVAPVRHVDIDEMIENDPL
jgi:hypothetical protein